MQKNNTRNYGIDLLRILSMFFVVTLHSLGHGGLLEKVAENSIQFKLVWILEIISYCAVDVFALISGFVSYTNEEKKFKISNFVKLWMQVVFYCLTFTLIFNIYDNSYVTKIDYVKAFSPITYDIYWYFTAYSALFIIMPLLNKGIRNYDNKTLKALFFVIIIVFSVFDNVADNFNLKKGYSFIWIALLYVLGAIIKKCEIGKNLKKYKIICSIFALYLITYLYKIYGFNIGETITKDLFISYTSPTILGVAILYVLLFSKMNFSNNINRVIKFCASSAFAVYLINEHPLVRENIITHLFERFAYYPVLQIFIYVISFSFIFVILSILIDKIRIVLFKILHIENLIDFVIQKLKVML